MNSKTSYCILVVALFFAALLTACAGDDEMTTNPSLMPTAATAVDADPAALRLARAAEQATLALHRMSEIESFRTPMPTDAGAAYGHPALMQPTSISWTGPIELITRTLSEMSGFAFKTVGKAPMAAIVVSVNAYQQPIGGILRDIGLQAGRRADVIVDVGTQTVNLRYAPDDGLLPK
jgi:defect-in-organelle-trafficking protein DotD